MKTEYTAEQQATINGAIVAIKTAAHESVTAIIRAVNSLGKILSRQLDRRHFVLESRLTPSFES
jgi:hypothetical protein